MRLVLELSTVLHAPMCGLRRVLSSVLTEPVANTNFPKFLFILSFLFFLFVCYLFLCFAGQDQR